jgi:DNA-binding transcriptional MerR regulator
LTYTLKTSEAAALLHVSPNTLRAWEQRFGFPRPQRSRGQHRIYSYAEIAPLRDALAEGLSISSAVSVARDAHAVDADALISALASFRSTEADAVMERSLLLRTTERSVNEVLLPAIGEIQRHRGDSSAAWAHASSWAVSWLQRASRLAVDENRRAGILLGDASHTELSVTRPYVAALELCLARAGIEVLRLPVLACERIADLTDVMSPDAVVIGGRGAGDAAVARWAAAVHALIGDVPCLLFRTGLECSPDGSESQLLDPSPLAASTQAVAVTVVRRWAATKRPDLTASSPRPPSAPPWPPPSPVP